MVLYYFDTSIWLDIIEARDEPNFQKGKYAQMILEKIIKDDGRIVFTKLISKELKNYGYTAHELRIFFQPLKKALLHIDVNRKQLGKAKDISRKRDVPFFDAVHAIVARDNKAILLTRDRHFKKLLDFTVPKAPEELLRISLIFSG